VPRQRLVDAGGLAGVVAQQLRAKLLLRLAGDRRIAADAQRGRRGPTLAGGAAVRPADRSLPRSARSM
ncbi:hypothetical protein, partial [Melaminivora alkalimesophila]|uniref:hypothetical protein n=1 Tax=Melaminivora alkalimesophila TaxID=1165852 RepID=UPI0019D3DB44